MLKHEANDNKSYSSLLLPRAKKILRASVLRKTEPSTYWVKNSFSPKDSKYSWSDFYAMENKRNKMVESFKKIYNRMTTSQLPETFILVALHYQPEETSCPTGGSYSDQILMVQLLDQHLSKDTVILIKEHKSQFYTHQEGASGRNSVFYKRMSEISTRVKFASVDDDPFKLIDRADAVVTISGTIGWESAVRGTPVLVFGRAWYEKMPRVFKVKTKAEVIEALQQLPQQKNKDLQSEIINFHIALEDSFVQAKHYKSYLNNDDVTMSESIDNIVKGIISHLNNKI